MPDITSILRAVSQGRSNLDLGDFDESTIELALDAGLGPIFYSALHNPQESQAVSPYLGELHGAELTARILTAELLDATEKILQSSTELARHLTLLKGIAICEEFYPEPHLRTMGDIDLLVTRDQQSLLESVLISLGYRQQSENPIEFYKTHHHSMPFFHSEKRIWVEVHTSLFPSSVAVARDRVFSDSHVKSQISPMVFRGIRTNRLSLELQIPYICAHMGEHLTFSRESFAFFDLVYLLRNKAGEKCNWNLLLSSLVGSTAAGHVYVILGYLVRQKIVTLSPDIFSRLFRIQRNVNVISMHVLQSIVEKYLLNGRPTGRFATPWNTKIIWETLLGPRHAYQNIVLVIWNLIFPPREKRRFGMILLGERILAAIGLRQKGGVPPVRPRVNK